MVIFVIWHFLNIKKNNPYEEGFRWKKHCVELQMHACIHREYKNEKHYSNVYFKQYEALTEGVEHFSFLLVKCPRISSFNIDPTMQPSSSVSIYIYVSHIFNEIRYKVENKLFMYECVCVCVRIRIYTSHFVFFHSFHGTFL